MSLQDLIILQEKCEELEAKLKKAKEALESIACNDRPELTSYQFVKNEISKERLVEMSVADTEIARQCLKELEE